MGGNGAGSKSSNMTVNRVASLFGVPVNQIRTSAQFLVQTGVAPNMQAALNQLGQQAQQNPTQQDQRTVLWATMSLAEEAQLRRQMGQTGDEAGRTGVFPMNKDYVASSKSFNVNYYLEHMGQNGIIVPYRDANGNFISSWHRHGLMEDNPSNPHMGVKQIIRNMDSGAKPLPQAINVARAESSAQTLQSFGINKSMAELSKMTPAQLQRELYGAGRVSRSYLSVMTNETGNRNTGFKQRDVLIEYTVNKGVHGIMTNNTAEREFIVGRGYDQKITGARWERVNVGGTWENKLVLSVKIVPGARSGYFQV